jgi:hypothetical protein
MFARLKFLAIPLCLALFIGAVAFAQAPAPAPNLLDNPWSFVHFFLEAVQNGRWLEAAAVLMVIAVGLFRLFGKSLHERIPDTSKWDAPFYFLLETKPGRWLLNSLTGIAGVIAAALATVGLSGVTWALIQPAVALIFTTAGLYQLAKDVWEWWQARKTAKVLVPPYVPAPAVTSDSEAAKKLRDL